MAAGALEKEAALFSADDDGIAVQRMAVSGGAEGADIVNTENAPVRPGDGAGLHISGRIKIGSDSNVYPIRQEASPPVNT